MRIIWGVEPNNVPRSIFTIFFSALEGQNCVESTSGECCFILRLAFSNSFGSDESSDNRFSIIRGISLIIHGGWLRVFVDVQGFAVRLPERPEFFSLQTQGNIEEIHLGKVYVDGYAKSVRFEKLMDTFLHSI